MERMKIEEMDVIATLKNIIRYLECESVAMRGNNNYCADKWQSPEDKPALNQMVWVFFKRCNVPYLHVYKGDKDVEWEDVTAWIKCPEVKI